jgi:hypothetical protein
LAGVRKADSALVEDNVANKWFISSVLARFFDLGNAESVFFHYKVRNGGEIKYPLPVNSTKPEAEIRCLLDTMG